MKRNKAPNKKKGEMTSKSKKEKIKYIIESLSHGWLPEERETSILFDRRSKRVHLETSIPATARRWFKAFWGQDGVVWDDKADTLKFSVPRDFCRKADLILKPKYRKKED